MKKYLQCGLDDEMYVHPSFDLFCDFESAKSDAHGFLFTNGYERETSRDTKGVYRVTGYDGYENSSFYVLEIFEVDVEPGDYLVTYHHAYNGVDFDISATFHSYEDAYQEMKTQYESFMDEMSEHIYEDGCDIDESSAIIDDGSEWHVWTIYAVK